MIGKPVRAEHIAAKRQEHDPVHDRRADPGTNDTERGETELAEDERVVERHVEREGQYGDPADRGRATQRGNVVPQHDEPERRQHSPGQHPRVVGDQPDDFRILPGVAQHRAQEPDAEHDRYARHRRRDHALLACIDDTLPVTGAETLRRDDADDRDHAHADQEQHPEPVAGQADRGEFIAAQPTDNDHVGDEHAHFRDISRGQRQSDAQQRRRLLARRRDFP